MARICLFFTYDLSVKDWEKLGILQRELEYARRLIALGHEVSWFTYGTAEEALRPKQEGWPVDVVPAYGTKKPPRGLSRFASSLLLPWKHRRALKQFNLLRTNQMRGVWVPLIAKWITGKPLLLRCGFEYWEGITHRGYPIWKRWIVYAMSWLAYRCADHVLLSSESTRFFVQRKFNVPARKITSFPNFVDTEVFHPSPDSGSSEKNNRVLFVGRLTYQKNLFNLLEACAELDLEIDLIGEGELREDLERFCRARGVRGNFLGRVPNQELPKYYRQAMVVALPSLWEGSSKVLLEAMASGAAVLASGIPWNAELVRQGLDGVLCGVSAAEIRDGLSKLRSDPEFRASLGSRARERVQTLASLDSAIQKEGGVYERLLCQQKGSEKSPRVTVLMSVYNGAKFLRASIESILHQTEGDFEFLIIDDGSIDGTREILEEYARKESRIRLIRQERQGLTRALNRGLELAQGTWIARQDADDLSLPGRLKASIRAIGDADLLVGSWLTMDDQGRTRETLSSRAHQWIPLWLFKRMLGYRNLCAHGTYFFRTDSARLAGGYREGFRYAQDYDFVLRMRDTFQIRLLGEPLAIVRRHEEAITEKHRDTQVAMGKLASFYARERRRRVYDSYSARAEASSLGATDEGAKAAALGALEALRREFPWHDRATNALGRIRPSRLWVEKSPGHSKTESPERH